MKKVFINPAASLLLARSGLVSFEDLWHLRSRPFKQKKDREIRLVILEGKTFFLKRYHRLPLLRPSGAEREWQGAFTLLRLGFSVPLPVALGMEKRVFPKRAFTLFQAASGKRLEDLFREGLWKGILPELAKFAGRFHQLGFSHQDFYLCHFFWEEREKRLTIIDLQRLRRSKKPKERWLIKDLAELFYSASQCLEKGDFERFAREFMASYADFLPLAKKEGFFSRVEKKMTRIARHDQKLKARSLKKGLS